VLSHAEGYSGWIGTKGQREGWLGGGRVTLAVTGPPETRVPLANREIGGSVCTALLWPSLVTTNIKVK
jgi:hypothetical protein